MGADLKTRDSILSTILYKVNSGEEFEVEELLRNKGHKLLYKAFGQYDILSLADTFSFEDEKMYSPCEKVTSSLSLSAFKCESGGYSTPENIIDWVDGSPILGFILLEFDKWFYSKDSQPGSCLSAQEIIISKLHEVTKEFGEIALYGGYGKSELYCFAKVDSLERLWAITNRCRSLVGSACFSGDGVNRDLPVFRNTQTTPCISFSCFEKSEDYFSVTGISGQSQASIHISCPSVFENKISEYFCDEMFSCNEMFGEHDILVQTNGVADTNLIVEAVINFRERWLNEIGATVNTKTFFQQEDKFTDVAVAPYQVTSAPLEIQNIGLVAARNPKLANRLHRFSHIMGAFHYNRSEQFLCLPIYKYIEHINRAINNIAEDHDAYYIVESEVKSSLELAESGLAQRVWSSLSSTGYNHAVPEPFGDGIFASLNGIEHVIHFIYKEWLICHQNLVEEFPLSQEEADEYGTLLPYTGFAKFNDMSGFSGDWGEAFNLPLSALYDPVGNEGNWLTITHEISHAIYNRFEIGIKTNGFADELNALNTDSWASPTEKATFHLHVYELFAHWYDYVHFYEENFAEYGVEIWRAWSTLSVFSERFQDYFFRSFYIYCAHNKPNLENFYAEGDAYEESTLLYLQQLYEKHLVLVHSFGINEEYLKKMQTKDVFKENIKQMWTSFSILDTFEEYKSEPFKIAINKEYDELNGNVESTCKGHFVIEGIENPYLYAKRVIQKAEPVDIKASIALIFSLKNCESFYFESE